MNKIRLIILFAFTILVLGISNTSSVKVNAADEEFVSKYETWDFEGSEEELTDYYIENDILVLNYLYSVV